MINLRKKRKSMGLSMAEIGRRIGVSRQAIFSFENGKMKPSVKTAKKYAAVLGINWVQIFDD